MDKADKQVEEGTGGMGEKPIIQKGLICRYVVPMYATTPSEDGYPDFCPPPTAKPGNIFRTGHSRSPSLAPLVGAVAERMLAHPAQSGQSPLSSVSSNVLEDGVMAQEIRYPFKRSIKGVARGFRGGKAISCGPFPAMSFLHIYIPRRAQPHTDHNLISHH